MAGATNAETPAPVGPVLRCQDEEKPASVVPSQDSDCRRRRASILFHFYAANRRSETEATKLWDRLIDMLFLSCNF